MALLDLKKFKYLLDIRGVDEEVLGNAPDGWLDTSVKFVRSKLYGGLVRNLSLPFTFVYKGAGLLRREYANYRLLSNVNLKVDKLNPVTWEYKNLYTGKLDFSKYEDEISGVTIPSTEKNISLQIDAFSDVEYAIPVEVDEAVTVKLTPLELAETADFIFLPSTDFRSNAYFALEVVTNQQLSVTASVKNAGFLADTSGFDMNGTEWFYKATTPTLLRCTGKISGFVNLGHFQMNCYKSDGSIVKTIYDVTNPSLVPLFFQIDFDFAEQMNTGERLYWYFPHVGSTNSDVGFNIAVGDFSLSYNTISPASFCKALPANYIYKYLIDQMNGTSNPPAITQSFLLTNGVLDQLYMTCTNSILVTQINNLYEAGETLQIGAKYLVLGADITYVKSNGTSQVYHVNETFKAIVGHPNFTTILGGFVRQITNAPQIIISWKTFFQSIYSLMGGQAGFGLDNGKACLEDLSYFYRRGAKVLDLGTNITPESYKLVPNLDVMINTIKVGYEDQQYDAINGSQEVNSGQEYVTDLTNPKTELNLISGIRADPYGIEQIRIIQANVDVNSAASKSDNDNFWLWLKASPETDPDPEKGIYYQPLRTEGLNSIQGVDSSYYNWYLSPKQNLLRGGAYLASIFDKMQGYEIRLTSYDKNINMVTIDKNNIRVAEADPIRISDLPQQIFIPSYVTFNTVFKFDAQDIIDSTPYGEIWFNHPFTGTLMKGFIQELAIDAAQNSPQDIKLCLTPDNNLLDIVH